MGQNRTATSAAADTDVFTAYSTATSETTSIDKNKKEKQRMKNTGAGEEVDRHAAVAVHSQVIRIKQEIEKLKEPSPEIRRLLLRNIKRQRSRSPLGIAERAILVGNT
ncbi:uncharacterized protein LOC114712210 [Neltuma alba]|uniref:uncharacterized protein LOC114712210 n=1 Tax=Neltuma alba TaxID=207710 RepID=UPI0010A2B9E2|nr:uncharacterized protein LOC114712210 [Prosopis alba]